MFVEETDALKGGKESVNTVSVWVCVCAHSLSTGWESSWQRSYHLCLCDWEQGERQRCWTQLRHYLAVLASYIMSMVHPGFSRGAVCFGRMVRRKKRAEVPNAHCYHSSATIPYLAVVFEKVHLSLLICFFVCGKGANTNLLAFILPFSYRNRNVARHKADQLYYLSPPSVQTTWVSSLQWSVTRVTFPFHPGVLRPGGTYAFSFPLGAPRWHAYSKLNKHDGENLIPEQLQGREWSIKPVCLREEVEYFAQAIVFWGSLKFNRIQVGYC